jgi:hypothetical protein
VLPATVQDLLAKLGKYADAVFYTSMQWRDENNRTAVNILKPLQAEGAKERFILKLSAQGPYFASQVQKGNNVKTPN